MEHSRMGFEQLQNEAHQAEKKDEAINKKIEVSKDLDRPVREMLAVLEKKMRSVLGLDAGTTTKKMEAYREIGHDEANVLNAKYDALRNKLQDYIDWAYMIQLGDNWSHISEEEMRKNISECEQLYKEFLELRAKLNERSVDKEEKYPKQHDWESHGSYLDLDTGKTGGSPYNKKG